MSSGDLGIIMERITKLLALSTSSNEHEAAAAAAKAQALMFRHNLIVAQLRAGAAGGTETYTRRVLTPGALSSWRRGLIHRLAEHNFCQAVTLVGTPRVAIVCEPHNIALVEQLYARLLGELMRLADAGWQQARRRTLDTPRQWKNGFLHGAVEALATRLAEQREEDAAAAVESLALVSRQDIGVAATFARYYPQATTNQRRAPISTDAWRWGQRAGETMAMDTPSGRVCVSVPWSATYTRLIPHQRCPENHLCLWLPSA
jgi:hypothetical protein